MKTQLELKGVYARYGATQVLHGISMDVVAGGVTALLGANGAGKTTALRAISGLVDVHQGSINLDGRSLLRLKPSDVAAQGIGHVPDGRGTIAELTTEENLQVGGWRLKSRKDVDAEMERMFERFPVLKERRRQQAGTLSGGEQQMLAIARALMSRPSLLLLDEPSFGVAPLVIVKIFDILREINREHSIGILLIEQNARLALDLADRAYVLSSGRITMQGSAAQLRDDPEIHRSYLGD